MNQTPINDQPISVQLDITTGVFSPCPEVVQRRVTDLVVMFYDRQAVKASIKATNPLVYEIRHYPFITSTSDMALGTSTIFPGKVGDEYFMTKGHYHASDDQPEIYHCVQGVGFLQLESMEGDYHLLPWKAGTITHIPPQFAHRVINTGSIPLVFVSAFHVAAGHVYGPIEARGFRNVVVERDGRAVEIPNPRRGG